MLNYSVDRKERLNSILDINQIEGYEIKPREDAKNPIKVTKIKIVDKQMIDKILSMKFERFFRRLVVLALQVVDDEDPSDDDANMVLDEAKLVKEILENRYKKFLSYEKEQLFLKKIRIIEKQMQMKKIEIKRKAIFLEMQENMHRKRGL